MAPMTAALQGFTVGLTGPYWAVEQVALLTGLGAQVIVGSADQGNGDDVGRPRDPASAERLVRLVCDGVVDAVTFTTVRAVRNFMTVADRARSGRNVLSALNKHTVVACGGKESASAAVEEGILRPLRPDVPEPEALVGVVRTELAERSRRYLVGASDVVLQGAVVLVDGLPLALDDLERALLSKLAERPGAIVRRRVLMRHVWKGPGVDPLLLEATLDSLRAKLGSLAPAVESPTGRGLRLRAVEGTPGEG